jgi:hypothetical protein
MRVQGQRPPIIGRRVIRVAGGQVAQEVSIRVARGHRHPREYSLTRYFKLIGVHRLVPHWSPTWGATWTTDAWGATGTRTTRASWAAEGRSENSQEQLHHHCQLGVDHVEGDRNLWGTRASGAARPKVWGSATTGHGNRGCRGTRQHTAWSTWTYGRRAYGAGGTGWIERAGRQSPASVKGR